MWWLEIALLLLTMLAMARIFQEISPRMATTLSMSSDTSPPSPPHRRTPKGLIVIVACLLIIAMFGSIFLLFSLFVNDVRENGKQSTTTPSGGTSALQSTPSS